MCLNANQKNQTQVLNARFWLVTTHFAFDFPDLHSNKNCMQGGLVIKSKLSCLSIDRFSNKLNLIQNAPKTIYLKMSMYLVYYWFIIIVIHSLYTGLWSFQNVGVRQLHTEEFFVQRFLQLFSHNPLSFHILLNFLGFMQYSCDLICRGIWVRKINTLIVIRKKL